MFINLHTHSSQGSLLDSIMTVDQIAEYAKKNNQSSIALTDHGSMSAFVSFQVACKKNGIKGIFGVEAYEVDNPLEKSDTKEYSQPRYHLILLAKNKQGLKNLFKIVSQGSTEFKYKKPRISIDWIKENNLGTGIIVLNACQAGRLSKLLWNDKENEAEEFVRKLQYTFDNFFIEIQSHNTPEQIFANKKIYNFAKKHDLPFVVTTDAHMVSEDQAETHSIFVQISEDRDVGESYSGCFLQNEQDIHNILKSTLPEEVINKAIQESINISDMIEDIDIGVGKGSVMPKIKPKEGFTNNEEYLKYLVYKDFDKKFGKMSEEKQQIRKDRIEIELPVLFKSNFTDYFIMLYMIVQEANKRNIPRGYSRGSGANCLCLYMLGVTQVDSVKWDLDFSRFANLGRKSPADYDFDISKKRRKEFIDISEELFGKENVAPIATFNTLSTKVAIRDIGKVLDEKGIYSLPYPLRDEVAKMIPVIEIINESGEKVEKETKLKEALFEVSKLKEYADQYPLWFKYVIELEGLPKSIGRHASGTLITPKPITNYCPVCYDKDGNIMAQLEMHSLMDDLGLVKMDYLGLETVDIVDDTLRMSGLKWEDVDINIINLNDKKVFDEVYKVGNTIGVFQMESFEAKRMCIEVEADNVEDVIAINALNRPGTKEEFPAYCSNKKNPNEAELIHDDLKQIFCKTNYILLYQEQALQVFRYAGFPEDEVDNARRAIGKKKKDVMEKLKQNLFVGLNNKGWSEDQINDIWELLLKQAEYSFNRGHSVGYGLLSYLTAYLKTYHPIEFMSACLSAKSDNLPKLTLFMSECNRLGIEILPPNVNNSSRTFTPQHNKNSILFGLMAIKGIGEKLVDQIIEERETNGNFKNSKDFIGRVSPSISNMVCLVKAGAIPCKNKMNYLLDYADSLFEIKPYTQVSSLPTKEILQEKFGLTFNKDVIREDKLKKYNEVKEREYNSLQSKKKQKHIDEFKDKYLQNESIWEYETISVFLDKNNTFVESYRYITPIEEIEINSKAVVVGILSDITKRTDKNGKQFAYLKVFSVYSMIEMICWHSQFKEYQTLLAKGNQLSFLCKKAGDGKLIVEKIKEYSTWLNDIQSKNLSKNS